MQKEGIPKIKKQSFLKSIASGKYFLQTFKVKRLYAELDTGDYPLNAQLIPIVQNFNNQDIDVKINFNNQNSVDFLIVTRLIKFLRIAIKHYLLTK